MLTIKPGQHGSTYGGNPVAAAVATASLQVLVDEKLADNAERMGRLFRDGLKAIKSSSVQTVRGKGLLNAMVIKDTREQGGFDAMDVCLEMARNGLLAKPTHGDIIRFAPPLVINEAQIKQGVDIIRRALESFK